ncbi:hypothetical protein RclHR1_09310012 [Rhizophagus clarus]|uniref:Uncharacterized protein n=1 Tax=Rhizophagus clarus TaxID=94130 RepID=A0A2Z6SQ13_9GLOM|nr:hypothetical protein RclHR1_09310012 [Rhizophagus clarus]
MEIAFKEDPVGVTLTFDGWTNVNNEQLLGTVILTSEGKPYVWKAVDISSEHENYTGVMNKTEKMLADLKKKEIAICAIVTDSASAYAAAWCRLRISNRSIILAINYEPPIVASRRQVGGEPTLLHEIFEIINSPTFWNRITDISQILDPYCKLLNVLQRDKARLFQVIHSMGYLVQFWLNYSDTSLASKIIDRLEKRWNEWEQPLLLLSYLLHPEYRMEQFNKSVSNINYSEFGK